MFLFILFVIMIINGFNDIPCIHSFSSIIYHKTIVVKYDRQQFVSCSCFINRQIFILFLSFYPVLLLFIPLPLSIDRPKSNLLILYYYLRTHFFRMLYQIYRVSSDFISFYFISFHLLVCVFLLNGGDSFFGSLI